MIVVHFPSWFPNADSPLNGNFILRQIGTIAHNTTSIIFRHTNADLELQLPDNLRIHPVQSKSKGGIPYAYFTEFQHLVKNYGKPDFLHLHVALPLGPIAAFLSRKYNIPLIVSEHWSIYQPVNRGQIKPLQRWLLQYIYRTAAHVTAVSQNLLDNIGATVPAAAKKPQTVVGNVVDTDLFSLKTAPLPSGKKQILHVSTLDNDAKNIMGILHATRQLSLQRSDFELNIVHDFRNEEAETFVRDNGLSDFVHFLGRKTSNEIAGLLHQSAFFLLFSNYENQPCVLLEAFSTGTPAVTTPVGGIPEITNEQNAVIVTPRDEVQLAEKMDIMLTNYQNFTPALIREKALKLCSPEIVGEKWMEIYRMEMQETRAGMGTSTKAQGH